MNDYDEVVAFCNSNVAEELIKDDSEIKKSLVVSDLIPDTDAIVVKKQEFLNWLYEKGGLIESIQEMYQPGKGVRGVFPGGAL